MYHQILVTNIQFPHQIDPADGQLRNTAWMYSKILQINARKLDDIFYGYQGLTHAQKLKLNCKFLGFVSSARLVAVVVRTTAGILDALAER